MDFDTTYQLRYVVCGPKEMFPQPLRGSMSTVLPPRASGALRVASSGAAVGCLQHTGGYPKHPETIETSKLLASK